MKNTIKIFKVIGTEQGPSAEGYYIHSNNGAMDFLYLVVGGEIEGWNVEDITIDTITFSKIKKKGLKNKVYVEVGGELEL